MKTSGLSVIALVLAVVAIGVGQVRATDGTVPGQIVMGIAPGHSSESVVQNRAMHLRDSIVAYRIYLAEISQDGTVEDILSDLSHDPAVLFAEPNYEVELPENFQMSQSFPDDNVPPLLEGVEPADFYQQPATYILDLDSTHQRSTGSGVTVAVIDNGVDFAHPLLAPRLLTSGYDFVDDDADPGFEAGTVASHGTFVSGLIVCTAPDVSLLPLRSFNGDGIGNSFSIAEAIYYAIGLNSHVLNMSFGMFDSSQIVAHACQTAVDNGLSLVAASGNNSLSQAIYPAAFSGVIAVSGVDQDDVLAAFSNYGDYIDVCAPAVDLYSCLAGPDYGWGTWSGTSFAAPFVSATCALVKALNPGLNAVDMEFHIRESAATDLIWGTVVPPDDYYGYGRLDPANAVWSINGALQLEVADMNGSGRVDVADAAHLARYIQGRGPGLNPNANPDLNCDGIVNNEDVDYLLQFLFHNGPTPQPCP